MPSLPLTGRAQSLRANRTRAEGLLWGRLRDERLGGWIWRRQVPRLFYIVDFFCPEAKLIIELDGSQHHAQASYDERRTRALQACGYSVVRYWNARVLRNLSGVCSEILERCGGAKADWSPKPPPSRQSHPAVFRRSN